jgi:hypothetical protein
MMLTALSGLAGGIVAWFLTNLVAQPLLRFFTLRGEVATALSLYRNVAPYLDETAHQEEKDILKERMRDGHKELRLLGARLLAFHQTEFVANALLRRLGFNSRLAAHAMFRVANTLGAFGSERHQARKDIDDALKFCSPEQD